MLNAAQELLRPVVSSGSLHPAGRNYPVANRVTYSFDPNRAKTLGRFTGYDSHSQGGRHLQHGKIPNISGILSSESSTPGQSRKSVSKPKTDRIDQISSDSSFERPCHFQPTGQKQTAILRPGRPA